MVKDRLESERDLRRSHSTSSLLSDAGTFHSTSSTIAGKENILRDQEETPKSRPDSGFGEMTADTSKRKDASEPLGFENVASGETLDVSRNPVAQPSPLPATHISEQPVERSVISPSTQRNSTRRASSHRSSMTDVTTVTLHETPYTSRQSSFKRTQNSANTSRRPTRIRHWSSNDVYVRSKLENPYLNHQIATEIFPSGFSSVPQATHPRPALCPTLSSRSSEAGFTFSHANSLSTSPTLSQATTTDGHSTPTPACTIIDWTRPSTRRRDYEKIDRSCQGFRGLWRRVAPRWCQGNSGRLAFYEDDNSDAGSVRRYRLELPSDDEEKRMQVRERELFLETRKARRVWNCFKAGNRRATT